MRRLRRIVTGTAIASLLALTMPPAAEAASRPLPQQWWFPAWAVNNKIWPTAQGQGVTVAVVDTGVQANLPDFSGAVLQGTDTTGGGGDGRTDTDSAAVPGHGTGMASLIATVEYDDLAHLCDRVLVFSHGRICADLRGDSLTPDAITAAAFIGSSPQPAA